MRGFRKRELDDVERALDTAAWFTLVRATALPEWVVYDDSYERPKGRIYAELDDDSALSAVQFHHVSLFPMYCWMVMTKFQMHCLLLEACRTKLCWKKRRARYTKRVTIHTILCVTFAEDRT